MTPPKNTSWQQVASWYDGIVGQDGHYYHQHVVLPGTLKLLELSADSRVLDIACGQGILSRAIPKVRQYLGLDSAKGLIEAAKRGVKNPDYSFMALDATKSWGNVPKNFTHACILLALQNIERADLAIKNASEHLDTKGKLLIVINHPMFRIPRQSGWGIDEKTKQQYRWVNRYASPLKVPITMHPGQKNEHTTWSFHKSLHDYVQMLAQAGFVIKNIEEWQSDKESVGKAAKMENRARAEFPLFMAILAEKQ